MMRLPNDFQLTSSLRKYAGSKSFVLPCVGAPEMCVDRYLWHFQKHVIVCVCDVCVCVCEDVETDFCF